MKVNPTMIVFVLFCVSLSCAVGADWAPGATVGLGAVLGVEARYRLGY